MFITLDEVNSAVFQVEGLATRRGYDPEDMVYKEAQTSFRAIVSNECWRIDIMNKNGGGSSISTDGRYFYYASSPSPEAIREGKSGWAEKHIGTIPLANQLDRGRVILFYLYASAGLFGRSGQRQLIPLEIMDKEQLPGVKYEFKIGSNSLPDYIETTFTYANKSIKTNRLEILERENIGDLVLPKRSMGSYRLTNPDGSEWPGGPYDTWEIVATNITLTIEPVSFVSVLTGMHAMTDRTLVVSNTIYALGHSKATNWFSSNELIQMYHEMKEQEKLKEMEKAQRIKIKPYAWIIVALAWVTPALALAYKNLKNTKTARKVKK